MASLPWLHHRGWLAPKLVLPVSAVLVLSVAVSAQDAGTAATDPRQLLPVDPDGLDPWLYWTARGVEVAGIAVIVLGAIAASLHVAWQLLRSGAGTEVYKAYRANLGRAILLGLELLVAADIIGTVAVDPTLDNLGILAAIVLIRTFLSFSLEVEIEGRWPWQQGRPSRAAADETRSPEPET